MQGEHIMIDVHTHILPNMDDGAQNVEESLQLLNKLMSQNINMVVLTPHFDLSTNSISEFIQRRDLSYAKLIKALPQQSPILIEGAEVMLSPSLIECENLHELCFKGTDFMLVELPFSGWGKWIINMLNSIIHTYKITPIIAHIERYYYYGEDNLLIDEILGMSVITQINASSFIHFSTKGKALNLIKDGYIDLIGSDTHSLNNRPPEMKKAIDIISKKLPPEYLENILVKSTQIIDMCKNVI
jgi:protein-tyrosine phosphatase